MPNIANIKPVIKVTEKQYKMLLNRILNEKGGIKKSAIRNPVLGEELSAGRVEGVTPPPQFERFPEPIREPMIPPPPEMLPLPSAGGYSTNQLEMRNILYGADSIQGGARTLPTIERVGEKVSPTRSDLIYNRVMSQIKGPSAIDKLGQYSEPVDKTMGRLYDESSGVRRSIDMPIAEARIQALQNPSLIPENSPKFPPVTQFKTIGGYPVHERLSWKPIESATAKEARNLIQKAAVEANVNITPKEANDLAIVFGDLWKSMGGGRSEEGRMWEELRKGSKAKVGAKNAKDYFIQSAGRWHKSPQSFQRQYPRENKRLQDAWNRYMNGGK